MIKKFLVSCCLTFSIFFGAKSQSSNASSFEIAQKNAIGTYLKAVGVRSYLLYNGSEYVMYQSTIREHPYLYINWELGTIDYDGQLYANVYLLYDLNSDQIITKSTAGGDFQLVKSFVNFFALGDRRFVHLRDSISVPGFYEILLEGKIGVYSKHEKIKFQSKLAHQAHSNDAQRDFLEKDRVLLYKDRKFVEVNSKEQLLQIFASQAKEVKRFMREKKLNFKPAAFENSVVQLVGFINTSRERQ
ncbi:MAG TPA: hypothetical protein VL728_00055 [Cyclobacteriaceae bacterium]|nr:hypothetical protein [Cyclobacteriaceae bacterium]